MPQENGELDRIDRLIVAALQVNGRAPWQQIAGVIGTSESTVARRAQRLIERGSVRIVATPDPIRCGLGYPVLVQIRCSAGAPAAVARALAARSDVRFVALITGNFDVVVELIVTSQRHLARVLVEELHRIPGIAGTTTESVLRHRKMTYDWSRDLLGEDAALQLAPEFPALGKTKALDPLDLRIVQMLSTDGRASFTELAARLDISESMARRRVDAMASDGRMRFSTLVQPHILGFDVELFVWLNVDLSRLEQVVEELAVRPEVRYLSITAGYSDVACEVILRDQDELYRFNIDVLGALDGIRRVEVGLELQTVKRAYLPVSGAASQAPDVVRAGQEFP